MNIKIKFIVASDAAIQILQDLAYIRLNEKYAGSLSQKLINDYLETRYNSRDLTLLLNDFSNKCLLVFVGDKPAGYAIFSDISQNPPVLKSKNVIHLIDLEVLEDFKDSNAKQELLKRFLAQCRTDQAVWTQEIADDEIIDFYIKNGFRQGQHTPHLHDLQVASVYLIKEIESNE